MKKLLGIFLLIPLMSIAQIKVDKSYEEAKVVGKIGNYIKITKKDNIYTFVYNDLNYTVDHFRSFSFTDTGNDFDKLYNTIQEGFSTPPKEPVKIVLEDGEYILLKYKKSVGVVNLQIIHYDSFGSSGTTANLTKRKVRKLFAKKK